MRFVLVTPSYNLSDFIEQTIYSVITQQGDFSIRYHIQDGGSTDGTKDILEKWKRVASEDAFPKFCREISFSYSIEPDAGMYDAVNRAFCIARDGDDPCAMSWINADDLLFPGALSAVASFFKQNPSAQLVGGRATVLSGEGFISGIRALTGHRRNDLAHGDDDGRTNAFLQQEGTFWRSELWDKVGGLNSALRYAGDFDLWRRFAKYTEYYQLDTLTGGHRKRRGQLSEDLEEYFSEVDSLKSAHESEEIVDDGVDGTFRFDLASGKWIFRELQTQTWRAVKGMSVLEGPHLEHGIESGRWVVDNNAVLEVWSKHSGESRLKIGFRNPNSTNRVRIAGISTSLRQDEIHNKLMMNLPFKAIKGWNPIEIHFERTTSVLNDSRRMAIFIENAELARCPSGAVANPTTRF